MGEKSVLKLQELFFYDVETCSFSNVPITYVLIPVLCYYWAWGKKGIWKTAVNYLH